ncbi:MAG: ATP-binding protein, partial [Actinomycetota bacterium]
IYPPVLAERGVAAALRAQAKRAGLRATVSCKEGDRFDPAIETAIYFCCLEAMQNAAKHGATRVAIRVEAAGDEVSFAVKDDGPGFDPNAVVRGSGLQNMEDRLAALGGTLTIRSQPGTGTEIAGRLAVRGRTT